MPDNAPVIGAGSPEGLLLATGHHRNGILLAPLTAALGAKLLSGEQIDASEQALLDACDPRRFTGGTAEQPAVAEAVHA